MKVPLQKTFFFNKPSCVKNHEEKLSRLVELLTTKQTCQPLGTITVLHKSKQKCVHLCKGLGLTRRASIGFSTFLNTDMEYLNIRSIPDGPVANTHTYHLK